MIDPSSTAAPLGPSAIAAMQVVPEDTVLEVKNLGVAFRSEAGLTQVVHDVSFTASASGSWASPDPARASQASL